MNTGLLPMLLAAVLIWTGLFGFLLLLERRVGRLEQQTTFDEDRAGGTIR